MAYHKAELLYDDGDDGDDGDGDDDRYWQEHYATRAQPKECHAIHYINTTGPMMSHILCLCQMVAY